MMSCKILAGAAVLLVAAGSASAQWSENFDSYSDGSSLYGVGGWSGWDGDSAVAGTVSSEQAHSVAHSIACSNNTDAIHPLAGYTSGQWTFTAYQYVPSTLDSVTYMLLQNVYADFGPYDWAVQLAVDPLNGDVHDDMQDFYGSGSNYLTAIFDEWVEIRCEIDLDNNYVETYYGGDLVSSGEWDTLLDGAVEIANLDLYAPHTETVYYDDISLVKAGGCFADFNGDGLVDTRDVIAFLNAWSANDASSDCDGNGLVDTRDVICFLNGWTAGC
ncbi:MAG: hypothetical protein IPJ41_16725 [Phycisphaerales bacterium]|nr:hypothetical protein [Phycisphaerales bacterium]